MIENSAPQNLKSGMEKLLGIMQELRKSCPWDAKQTHDSLKPYLLEEAYEVLETIDQREYPLLAKELGDLLLQIVFHSQIASEQDHFNFADVVKNITDKLIERHPHVFGDKHAASAEAVQSTWEHSKLKSENRSSVLEGLPKTMPALLSAQRLQEKAAAVGFEWYTIQPVFEKVEEEWAEFKEVYTEMDTIKMKQEFGDILFTMVNLGRYLGINSEDALRLTNSKFTRRFQHIEKNYKHNLLAMKEASLDELDRYWEEAKKAEDK